jgi:UDP-perosamine 4-acetyltransferase
VKRVVGIGAGGHSRVVIDILRLNGGYEVVGLLDRESGLWGSYVLDVPVLGDDDLLPKLRGEAVTHAFIGVGGVGDTEPRRRLYEMASEHGFEMVCAIHPRATVAASAVLGSGPTVMANAVINPEARLGDNVVVNTSAIVEHGCIIEDHAHIATGAHLGGDVRVGSGSHIGIGASVRQEVSVGRGAVVGAGAAVVSDVPDFAVVAGVPARPLKVATPDG